jgi:D-arabinose 5-phosphate isomerase GutQ
MGGIYCAEVSVTLREIESQPALWDRAAGVVGEVRASLPEPGQRVAIMGCGTSYYIAQAVAVKRESRRLGETDAFVASEMPAARSYDLVVAISRSGTTTEVVRALAALPDAMPSLAISAVPDTPVVNAAADAVLLPFADESSIVQTRFATTVLALMRAYFGEDVGPAIADTRAAPSGPLPVDPRSLNSSCSWAGDGPSGSRSKPRSSSARREAHGPRPIPRWSIATGRSAWPGRGRWRGFWGSPIRTWSRRFAALGPRYRSAVSIRWRSSSRSSAPRWRLGKRAGSIPINLGT